MKERRNTPVSCKKDQKSPRGENGWEGTPLARSRGRNPCPPYPVGKDENVTLFETESNQTLKKKKIKKGIQLIRDEKFVRRSKKKKVRIVKLLGRPLRGGIKGEKKIFMRKGPSVKEKKKKKKGPTPPE